MLKSTRQISPTNRENVGVEQNGQMVDSTKTQKSKQGSWQNILESNSQ